MIRKIGGLLLMSGVVSAWGADAVDNEKDKVAPIVAARQEMSIDGKLDEQAWERAPEVVVDALWGKNGQRTEQPRMTAKYLWDKQYLYIGYEVFDKNLIVRAEGDPQGPEGNQRQGCDIVPGLDVVEFFLVFEPTFFWEIHHNAANHFNDVLCIVNLAAWQKSRIGLAGAGIYFAKEEYIQDSDEHTLARAVVLKPTEEGKQSTVNDASDKDAGYTGEIRLPWLGIGAPADAQTWIEVEPAKNGKPAVMKRGPWKMKGREISILAVAQDSDSADRYCTSAPDLPVAFFHTSTARYPRYRFTREETHDAEEIQNQPGSLPQRAR